MVEKKTPAKSKAAPKKKTPAKKAAPPEPKGLKLSPKAMLFGLVAIILVVVIIMLIPTGKNEERVYLLEQVGNLGIARIYADGFDELSLDEKLLAYHLQQAALAGDPIAYDQLHRYAPKVKMVLENILTNSEGIDSDVLEKITNYTKRFWANSSHYSIRNKSKILPEFTFEEFKDAAQKAADNGASFKLRTGETVESMVEGLKRTMFDADYEPLLTVKSPPRGEDIITASANNFYEDVTLGEVEAFNEQYALNSRLAKVDGHIEEQVYRSGDGNIPPGKYAPYISKIITHLRSSLDYANNDQKDTIQKLIRYYQTGSKDDWYKFNIAWVDDKFNIDFINGFIESYIDARSVKATFESFVFFIDKETTKMMTGIADIAADLEEAAPWDDAYKKKGFKPPVGKSIKILAATGDGGPQCPLGINLPNEQDIRETYGSKSVLLTNVINTYQGAVAAKEIEEFIYDDDEKERAKKYGLEAYNLKVALHEVVGHGSGKVSPDLKGDPSTYIKEYYSTLEEARAELMALWSIRNDLMLDKKIMSHEDVILTAYEAYPRSALVMLRRIKTGDVIEDDHMRATNLIVNYWKEKGSVDVEEDGNKFYMKINDFDEMQEQTGELLATIMKIKAEGDYEGAKKLIEKYGMKFNTALRDDVVKRCAEIGYPDFVAMVMPELKLITDDDGNPVDVKVEYNDDFKTQMLRYSEYVEPEEEEQD